MESTTGNRRIPVPGRQAYPIRTEIIAYGHFSSKKCLPSPSIVVNKPFTIKIAVGTVVVAALVDTGSTTSVISAAFEKLMPYKQKKEKETTNLKLITACGDPMKNVKTIETSVKLHSVDGNPVKNRFQVVQHLQHSQYSVFWGWISLLEWSSGFIQRVEEYHIKITG